MISSQALSLCLSNEKLAFADAPIETLAPQGDKFARAYLDIAKGVMITVQGH